MDGRGGLSPRPPGRWRVGSRVVVLAAVPVLLALVLAVSAVAGDVATRTDRARADRAAGVVAATTALVDGLQAERDLAAAWVATDRRGDRAALDGATGRVDQDAGALRALAGGDLEPVVGDRAAAAVAALDGLTTLRATVLTGRDPAPAVIAGYTAVVEPALALERGALAADGDPVGSAAALPALARVTETVEVQHALLLAGTLDDGGRLAPDVAASLQGAALRQTAATADLEAVAPPAVLRSYRDTVAGPAVDQRTALLQTALSRGAQGLPTGVDPVVWDGASDAVRGDLRRVEAPVVGSLVAATRADLESASSAISRTVVLVLLGLLVVLVVALVVGRSLRAVAGAREEAGEAVGTAGGPEAPVLEAGTPAGTPPADAPEPVLVPADGDSDDHATGGTATPVAASGAEHALRGDTLTSLFVNLSRRSQSLVERQLRLIDRLEARADDPDLLAQLFELDSLATRMRRNGENLLVLGGVSFGGTAVEPVVVDELLHAAVSEVEQYTRVALDPVPGVAVAGPAVNDVTHLLAELLDNATSFSPPGTPVAVTGGRSPDGGLVLEIVDHGLGMDEHDLAEANVRLERVQLFDASLPRRMGLFVVGTLARRHGVTVHLRPGTDDGVVAVVAIPPALVLDGSGGEGSAGGAAADDPGTGEPADDEPVDGEPGAAAGESASLVDPGDGDDDGRVAGDEMDRDEVDDETDAGAEVDEDGEGTPADPVTQELAIPVVDPHTGPIGPVAGPGTDGAPEDRNDSDDPGTLEPIFTAMASVWFQERRPGTDDEPEDPAGAPPRPSVPGSAAWASAADAGWTAAAAPSVTMGRTAVGLPRRRRGAQLVPGAATPPANAPDADPAPSSRPATLDPDTVRDRLSRYQQGMARGRRETGRGPDQDPGSGGEPGIAVAEEPPTGVGVGRPDPGHPG